MKYDIAALKRKMLVKYPFFGSVVASVKYKENKEIPTAGTDGKTIYYNPTFLEELSVEEQTFIFAHEVCHIAFNHIFRSEGKDPQIWNTATDAVINAFLQRDGLKMVEGGVDIADAVNYDAEQLYEKLLKEKQQKQGQQGQSQQQNGQQGQNSQQQQSQGSGGQSQSEQNQNGQGQSNENQEQNSQQQQSQGGGSGSNGEQSDQKDQQSQGGGSSSNGEQSDQKNQQSQGGGSGSNGEQSDQKDQQSQGSSGGNSSGEEKENKQDVGHDTHSMWEDAVKKHKEEQSKEKKESLFDKLFNRNKKEQEEEEKSEVEKKQEECEALGEKGAFKQNKEDKRKELEELKKALAQQSTAGTTTNRETRTVDEIGKAKPLIDWRYILREAIQYDVDWSYKNAYIEDGVLSANLEEQPMPETEIVLDTSGSINEVLLKNFLRECKNILQHSKVKVGCFDTEFYGFHEIRTEEDIETMKFQGGGGTDFNAAVGAFSRRVENKIVFTDGEASMPEMPIDAIWIVFGDMKINPKGGRVIYITDEQLEKLYSFEMDKGRSR